MIYNTTKLINITKKHDLPVKGTDTRILFCARLSWKSQLEKATTTEKLNRSRHIANNVMLKVIRSPILYQPLPENYLSLFLCHLYIHQYYQHQHLVCHPFFEIGKFCTAYTSPADGLLYFSRKSIRII